MKTIIFFDMVSEYEDSIFDEIFLRTMKQSASDLCQCDPKAKVAYIYPKGIILVTDMAAYDYKPTLVSELTFRFNYFFAANLDTYTSFCEWEKEISRINNLTEIMNHGVFFDSIFEPHTEEYISSILNEYVKKYGGWYVMPYKEIAECKYVECQENMDWRNIYG